MNRIVLGWIMGVLFTAGAGCGDAKRAAIDPRPPLENQGRLDLETERVVVFKDGYGLFVKSAVGRTDDHGIVYTDEVPEAAVLGAFWAFLEDGRPIVSMTAGWVETTERQTRTSSCTSIREVLRANAGRAVTLELTDERLVEGTLVGLLESAPPERDEPAGPQASAVGVSPSPAWWSAVRHLDSPGEMRSQPGETSREIEPRGGDLVALDLSGGGRTVLPVASVRSVSGPAIETSIARTTETKRRSKRLTFDLGRSEARDRVALRILYFVPGIRWIPTYRMDGDLEGSASLTLQGEILNEVEEIDGAALDLVVGVPNFRFKDVVSPFVLEATLLNALQSAAPDLMSQSMSNTFTQRSSEWRSSAPTAARQDRSFEVPSQLVSDRNQDLFVYGQDDVTIQKGARAAVGLWRRTVPLSHVYTMETRIVRNARTGTTRTPTRSESGSLDPSPLRLSRGLVWHSLELVNDGEVPWTTGPVFLMRRAFPLGQELLTYTSPGGRTRVPVTVAVDVRGSHDEQEVDRTFAATTIDGHSYTLVRKEGTIRLTNYKEEPIDVEAGVSFGGTADTASDDGRISIDDLHPGDWDEGTTPLNNHSAVHWRLRLDPGQTKTLTYTCSYYVR